MADHSLQKKKILILSVSAGAGHGRAAEALRTRAMLDYPDSIVQHVDVMDFASLAFRKVYTDFYLHLVNKAPNLWGYLYNYSNDAKPDSSLEKMRRAIEKWNAKSLLQFIQDFSPSAIICTHFLPAEILSRLHASAEIAYPTWVQVTDFDLHRMWVHPHMQGYFAANEEVAFRMRGQGLMASTIRVTGIPIMPSFAKAPAREVCAAELGCDPTCLTLMLMSGGSGVGDMATLAERILSMEIDGKQSDFQMIVLTGKNQVAYQRLLDLQSRYCKRLYPIGFSTQVERLMACADLIVTKPGGLTTSECLAMGLPMIVNAPIPGQEERNADYVVEHGAALKAVDEVALLYRIQHLMSRRDHLDMMRTRALQIARPNAAADVMHTVMDFLTQ
ncbi:glycosyltransferase [Undibacterium cyanobacteriorum]|uniref:Glycosyltransferase n=1 Tax=Undibacterium cyanobacteriorum TaxID=3073561 RepID=A0ABY9RDX0_9BURK|nr:glycosyltransferase [Undibacterium sp. 20NA77.5]WMW79412.1 glycosyltransferase [Undibacterium sp. 20NA77.5]